jgi:hypothetical protein
MEPAESVRTRIRFTISSGKYQRMFSFGDGVSSEKTLASNAVVFNIGSDGRAIKENHSA